jgi:hypothetical protein
VNAGSVDVYCDLHRKCASVKALDGERKGRVVDKPRQVVVRGVVLRVSEAGRQRAVRLGVRNVHAFARGHIDVLSTVAGVVAQAGAFRVHYNPFKAGTFVDDAGAAVHALSILAIDGKTAWGVR